MRICCAYLGLSPTLIRPSCEATVTVLVVSADPYVPGLEMDDKPFMGTWNPDSSIDIARSEVGGKRVCKDRAPQPGGRFVPSVRACAQCYSCRIRDKKRALSPSLFPFGLGGISFPFSLQDLSVGACLSKSEQI